MKSDDLIHAQSSFRFRHTAIWAGSESGFRDNSSS